MQGSRCRVHGAAFSRYLVQRLNLRRRSGREEHTEHSLVDIRLESTDLEAADAMRYVGGAVVHCEHRDEVLCSRDAGVCGCNSVTAWG